jgi:hypothetical protein
MKRKKAKKVRFDHAVPLTWADAWLLHAIVMAEKDGAAALHDVIDVGDYINHAVFTLAELDGGAARLAAAGLISVRGKALLPAPEVLTFCKGLKKRSVLAIGQALQEAIGSQPSQPGYEPNTCDPRWRTGLFTEQDLRR